VINNKNYTQSSVFKPENLLREAKRQKNLSDKADVPDICILDPDSDILKYLLKTKQAAIDTNWPCYHTALYRFKLNNRETGIIGGAVGAPFAVLTAEQLFVSGCKLLISIASAGIIIPPINNSKYILIKSSLRDEGTGYHYLPTDMYVSINNNLFDKISVLFNDQELSLEPGKSWTTDAPFRETPESIEFAKNQGINAVEMEASALYCLAAAKHKNIICFAHLTNTMAQNQIDFEKGAENGGIDSLILINNTINLLSGYIPQENNYEK